MQASGLYGNVSIILPSYFEIISTNGFVQSEEGPIRWDGETEQPSITYRFQVPPGVNRIGEFRIRQLDEWLLCPSSFVTLRSTFAVSHRVSLATPGRIVEGFLVAGILENATGRAATGQTFEAIAPVSVDVDLTKTIEYHIQASEGFLGGFRSSHISALVFITGGRSNPTGSSGVIYLDRIVPHTVFHEFIHLYQQADLRGDARWLAEGSAEYYAALLTYAYGYRSEAETRAFIETDEDSEKRLDQAGPNRHYTKGRRVCAALDAKIRAETDNRRTFQHVFDDVFTTPPVEESIDFEDLLGRIESVTGLDLADWLTPYIRTSRVPPVPFDTPLTLLSYDTPPDADDDGVPNAEEFETGTDPMDPDTDNDGISDGAELHTYETNATFKDTDHDGLDDGKELEYGTDPTDPDTDNDFTEDGYEVYKGTDPLEPPIWHPLMRIARQISEWVAKTF